MLADEPALSSGADDPLHSRADAVHRAWLPRGTPSNRMERAGGRVSGKKQQALKYTARNDGNVTIKLRAEAQPAERTRVTKVATTTIIMK